mgnify:CR=1 FL=1
MWLKLQALICLTRCPALTFWLCASPHGAICKCEQADLCSCPTYCNDPRSCVHPTVSEENDRETVDAACRNMTASWVRAKAETDSSVQTCDFFETYDTAASDADLSGIYNIHDLKALGKQRGWCPYFMARHVISFANVVVYNYQYMLDPKIATLVSRELEDKSIVVFDEAHNIDNVCIESMSVTLDRRLLDASSRNLNRLNTHIKRMKEADARRLQDEYQRLLTGLQDGGAGAHAHARSSSSSGGGGVAAAGGGGSSAPHAAGAAGRGTAIRGGEERLSSTALPQDILAEAIPGNIRNAELFVRFMKYVVRWLQQRIKVAAVETEVPASFLNRMSTALHLDPKPLKFAYSRLSSLMRTLEITDMDEFAPLHLVADFCTLITTYPVGFMVVLEPYNSKTPHIPDPIMQLACLDASLAIKPVFQKFQSVILMSGTLSPLDMYPKMLNFHPVVRASFEMSITRPCISPMVVTKGADQTILSSRFESRDDPSVTTNYADLVISMAAVVPDGMVVFFPSYSYMERTVMQWHESGKLTALQQHKLLFIETKDIVETTLSLNNFKKACDCGRGAVFLSVARGKVAEGIDFDRHYGRAVVLIGIPFQYTLSHVLRARLVYLRDTFHIREQDFLTFDALRQSSQCVGRVIRSKADYGLMVFADSRYARADKRSKLPQWITQFMPDAHTNLSTDMACNIAQTFFKELAQPLPQSASLGHSLLSKEHVMKLSLRTSASPPVPPAQAGTAAVAAQSGFVDASGGGGAVFGTSGTSGEDAGVLTDSRHASKVGGVRRPREEPQGGSMPPEGGVPADAEGDTDLTGSIAAAPLVSVPGTSNSAVAPGAPAQAYGFTSSSGGALQDMSVEDALAAFVDEDELW